MFERAKELDSLTETQKIGVGAVGLLLGVALIALLVAAPLSTLGQVGVGLLGVAMMVVGTLALGTSESRDQVV